MSVTGSSANIVARIQAVIPKGWFGWTASIRDAILGGLADSAAWCYGLIGYARAQGRLATAYGIFLDIFAYDFLGSTLTRGKSSDSTFRPVIKATVLQERVTRNGMTGAIGTLTGITPWLFEPWNPADTGAYSGKSFKGGQFGYGVGKGGYGNMKLPAQAFLVVTRSASSGIPNVSGYGNGAAGYGQGALEYSGNNIALSGITDEMIQKAVSLTKPTGTTVWMRIGAQPSPQPKIPAIFNSAKASQNLAII
jgi:hypothetical protein